jgi:hypothetical protein
MNTEIKKNNIIKNNKKKYNNIKKYIDEKDTYEKKNITKYNIYKKKYSGGDGYSVDINDNIAGMPQYMRYTDNDKPIFNGSLLQNGGDGYSVNINKNIAGMPVYSRYTDNDEPVFNGSLLQNGGDGYSVNVNEAIAGMPAYPRYSNNYRPVFNGPLLQNGGNNNDCGCSKKESTVFDLIKLNGGAKNLNKPSQFSAIKEVSYLMSPLHVESLLSIILYIFLNSFMKTKPTKAKQMGGYVSELSNIIAPLGKNNLIVLASLLLLHYFAVEKNNKVISGENKLKNKISIGGSNPLTQILAPLGVNALGSSVLLVMIREAFIKTNPNQINKISKKQSGGNPLKNLIAPLGTNAFIATGIIVALEVLFLNKIKEIKSKDSDKKKLVGGKLNKNFEKIFNILAPITFNTFATESFLKKMATNKK